MNQKLRGKFPSKLFKYGNIKKILKWEVWAPGLGPEEVQSVMNSSVITVMGSKKEIPEENSSRKIKLQVLCPFKGVTCRVIFLLILQLILKLQMFFKIFVQNSTSYSSEITTKY